ncbi:MAG TPA: SatD family protein [Balneolales bacterium]|nr:SatD family protein [Balneolales bacterium]
MEKYAVLTGDVVNSSQLNRKEREKLEKDLWQSLEKIESQKTKYEVIRGDSFQILLEKPQFALRKAIQMRCLIKMGMANISGNKVDTRIAIGIGEISFLGKTLGSSDGDAFRRSGLGLDELKKSKNRIIIMTEDKKDNEILRIITTLADVIISGWSVAQSEAVYYSSIGLTQVKIAKKCSIVQSAVNKRLQTAHWNEINEVLIFFEKQYV